METEKIQQEENLWEQFVAMKEQLKREDLMRSLSVENENCRQEKNFRAAPLWQFGQLTNNF